MFKRAVRRIRRFFASYVSPLGWAVTGAGIACLIAFPFLGWYELLVFGIVAMVMMLAAIVLSLGNTRFHASIVVSNHRVTVGDTVSVIVGIDNTGITPTTTILEGSILSFFAYQVFMVAPNICCGDLQVERCGISSG